MTVEQALSDTVAAVSAPVPGEETAAPSSPSPELSEDDGLSAIYDKFVSDRQEEAAPAEGEEPAGRERDAQGRFVAREGAQPEEGEDTQPDQASLEGEEAETDQGSTAGEVSAPEHLPGALKEAWKDIPETARSAIVAHQKDMDQKFGAIGRQLQQVKPVADRLTSLTQTHPELFGQMAPDQIAQGAAELAAIQATLDRGSPEDRMRTILEVAQTYGVLEHLKGLFTGQEGSSDTAHLAQQLADMKRGQSQQQITPEVIQEQVSAAIEQRETEAAVNAFFADTKARPFIEAVADDMPGFVQMVRERQPGLGLPETLEQAYDMAINANPAVRSKVRELEAKAATTAHADTKRKDAAEKAASINVKSSSTGKTREPSEDEAMGSVYDRMMAG